MRDFVIMTDSCCDLTDQMARELELEVVPLSLHMGDHLYQNWLDGRDIPFEEFYARIRAGSTLTDGVAAAAALNTDMYTIAEGIANKLFVAYAPYTGE